MTPVVYFAVPCYNEEQVLPETSKRLSEKLRYLISENKVSNESKIIFINDGSSDSTWEMICSLHAEDPIFSGICLSRNRGHQNALLAGLLTFYNECDCMISLDADLQDDINVIDQMVEKFNAGCDIVYGVRSQRDTDTAFKRTTAQSYYKILSAFGVEIVYNHADYRLISRRAIAALSDYREQSLFLRGIIPQLGFKTDTVYYARKERFAGESKYSLKKMLKLAFDGIFSFSVTPIKLISLLGASTLFLSFLFLIFMIVSAYLGQTPFNWKIVVFCILLFSGLILVSLGILGEYIGRILLETKARPRFIISEIVHEK